MEPQTVIDHCAASPHRTAPVFLFFGLLSQQSPALCGLRQQMRGWEFPAATMCKLSASSPELLL
jgi:hypothetical protein